MSSSSLGTRREYDVIDTFIARGFWWLKANRSGQSIEKTRAAARIPCDVLFYAPNHGYVQVEAGGAGKRLAVTFTELRERLLPGASPMLVMFKNRKRYYYISEDDRFDSLDDALDALRDQ
jgi:hypothetical protein